MIEFEKIILFYKDLFKTLMKSMFQFVVIIEIQIGKDAINA